MDHTLPSTPLPARAFIAWPSSLPHSTPLHPDCASIHRCSALARGLGGPGTCPCRPPYGGRVSSESFTSYPQYSLSAPLTNPRTHVHRFGSVLGAGSPHFLDIKTGAADESKTYIYGSLLAVAAGKTSFAYVQTRDKYGNNIRVNPDDTGSEGPDNVQFELCNEVRPVCVHVPLAVLCSAQPEGAGLGASPADTFELPRTAARAWHALCHA